MLCPVGNHYVISNVVGNLSQAIQAKLPSVACLKRTIRYNRQKTSNGPALPNSRAEIIFEDSFKTTESGEQFLLFDSGPDDDRILIFTTAKNMKM